MGDLTRTRAGSLGFPALSAGPSMAGLGAAGGVAGAGAGLGTGLGAAAGVAVLPLTRAGMDWFIAHYLRSGADKADWRASPLRASSLKGLPPALILTAGFDPLRDEGEAYGKRLREAGVSVDAVCFGGMIHGFAPMGRLIQTGNRAVSLVAGSLRHALR